MPNLQLKCNVWIPCKGVTPLPPRCIPPTRSTRPNHAHLSTTSSYPTYQSLFLPFIHRSCIRHVIRTHAAASAAANSNNEDSSFKQEHRHQLNEHASQYNNQQHNNTHPSTTPSPYSSASATSSQDPDEYHDYPPPPTAEEFCHWIIKGHDEDPHQSDTAPSSQERDMQIAISTLQTGLKISLAYCALGVIIARKTSVAVSKVAWQHLLTTAKFCHMVAVQMWYVTVVIARFIGHVCHVVWEWLVRVWVVVSEFLTNSWLRTKRLVPVYARQARVTTVKFVPKSAREKWKEMSKPDPSVPKKGLWDKIFWWWEHPVVKSVRITLSVANFGVRLPAIMALGTAVMTQLGLLTSQFTLPMLAPLLLGTGMLLQSVSTNASLLLPRFGLLLVLLWLIWVVSSVIMNTWVILRRQGRLDVRTAAGLITLTETTALVVALIVLLSMVGVNISALLLPAAICMAFASRDLLSNMMAGLFLFIAQPFRIGDTVAVISSAPTQATSSVIGSKQSAPTGPGGNWFQGECEKVDLRYTVLRQGKWRLMVPNASFILREFMVADNPDAPPTPTAAAPGNTASDPAAAPIDPTGTMSMDNLPRPMFLWPYGPDGSMPTASAWFFRVGPPGAGQPAPAASPQVPPADPWNPATGYSMSQYSFPVTGPDGTPSGSHLSVYASYEEVPPAAVPPSPYTAPYPLPPSPWTAPSSTSTQPPPPLSQNPPQQAPPSNPTTQASPAQPAPTNSSHPAQSLPASTIPATSTHSAQSSPPGTYINTPPPSFASASSSSFSSAPPPCHFPGSTTASTPPWPAVTQSSTFPPAAAQPHPQSQSESSSAPPPPVQTMYPYPMAPYPTISPQGPLAFTSPSVPPHWSVSSHPPPMYPPVHPYQTTDQSFPPHTPAVIPSHPTLTSSNTSGVHLSTEEEANIHPGPQQGSNSTGAYLSTEEEANIYPGPPHGSTSQTAAFLAANHSMSAGTVSAFSPSHVTATNPPPLPRSDPTATAPATQSPTSTLDAANMMNTFTEMPRHSTFTHSSPVQSGNSEPNQFISPALVNAPLGLSPFPAAGSGSPVNSPTVLPQHTQVMEYKSEETEKAPSSLSCTTAQGTDTSYPATSMEHAVMDDTRTSPSYAEDKGDSHPSMLPLPSELDKMQASSSPTTKDTDPSRSSNLSGPPETKEMRTSSSRTKDTDSSCSSNLLVPPERKETQTSSSTTKDASDVSQPATLLVASAAPASGFVIEAQQQASRMGQDDTPSNPTGDAVHDLKPYEDANEGSAPGSGHGVEKTPTVKTPTNTSGP